MTLYVKYRVKMRWIIAVYCSSRLQWRLLNFIFSKYCILLKIFPSGLKPDLCSQHRIQCLCHKLHKRSTLLRAFMLVQQHVGVALQLGKCHCVDSRIISNGECSWADCVGVGADTHWLRDAFTSGIATQKGEKWLEEKVCVTTELLEADGGWIVEMWVCEADQSQSFWSTLLQQVVIFLERCMLSYICQGDK